MLIMCSAVFFMIKHRSRLLRFAEADITYSLPCLRPGLHGQFGPPLGSRQIGHGTRRAVGVAWVCAWLTHGSFAAWRLQVRVTTVEPMSVCV